MKTVWRPQHYQEEGRRRGVSIELLRHAISAGKGVVAVNPALPPIFTLRHLAHETNVSYSYLRTVASRLDGDPYKVFTIAKTVREPKKRAFRVICVPDTELMKAQRWINAHILSYAVPHSASHAYAKGGSIIDAARPHCAKPWLIKLDVQQFFESLSEIRVYRVFRTLGYQALVSFELARLCTRLGSLTPGRSRARWQPWPAKRTSISAYSHSRMGHLPQGAPTSPMLANLAVRDMDEQLTTLAVDAGFVYTRYADDLAFSTDSTSFTRKNAMEFVGLVYKVMARNGLSPNRTKTRIAPPGARKTLLGLLIDGASPRLTREFRARLRQHLYFLTNTEIGPIRHAQARGFTAVLGLRHHIEGLVSFAAQVDPVYAARCTKTLQNVGWPV
jgi:RNA-directed DNA polymerase